MTTRLKIGILCHPTYGGSGVIASELALTLALEGHKVHLFSHEVPPRLARSPGPVEMHVAQGVPYPLFHSTPHDLAITSRVLEVHRDSGLDVIHAHYALPHAVSAFLARAAAQNDRCGRPAPKVVTTLHGTDITLVGNDPSYAPLNEFVVWASDAVTAVSQSLAHQTQQIFNPDSGPCRTIEVIPNFVDLELFKPMDEERHAGPPSAVHVSNFRPVKRVPWLLRAFEEATRGTEARLVLVGDGPDQAECRQIARELEFCERVSFLGSRDALPALLAPADAFLLASESESFGLSALEAMACGTPVVSTNVGGVSEVVDHGSAGFLSDVGDRTTFAANVKRLLTDRDLAKRMGAQARALAEARFDRLAVVQQYEAVYRRVLANGS